MSSTENEILDNRNEEVSISKMLVKVPPFMETAVTSWFFILEAQFHVAKITTNNSKFYHALANLPAEIVSRISLTELESKDFGILKNIVIRLFEKSKVDLFNDLLSRQSMVGKPSIFLRDILSSASKLNIPEEMVRIKFIQALPSNIKNVVAAQSSLNLDQLGNLADDLFSLTPVTTINSVTSTQQSKQFQQPKQFFREDFSNNTPIGLRPYYGKQKPRVCRAHIYYGAQAKTCKIWCKWPKKGEVTFQPSSRNNSRSSSPVISRAASPDRNVKGNLQSELTYIQ